MCYFNVLIPKNEFSVTVDLSLLAMNSHLFIVIICLLAIILRGLKPLKGVNASLNVLINFAVRTRMCLVYARKC